MPRLLALLLLLVTANTQAELYKWTDAEGRTHFGDRPPVNQQTETLNVEIQNNDFELVSDEAEAYFERVRTNQAISQQKQQQDAQASATARQQYCQKARNRLQKLKGRVVFYDDAGNTFDIPETERLQKEQALQKDIQRYCS